MPIDKGTTEYSQIKKGTTNISEIYIGNTLKFSDFKVVSLGSGKSFNIANIYSGYANLTANNFFVLSASDATGSQAISVPAKPGTSGRERYGGFNFNAKLIKSYNASTGVLTMYNCVAKADGTEIGTANVTAGMVIKTGKLINLGTAQSFNLTSYSNYKKFTADNFLILSAANVTAGGGSFYYQTYAYADSGTGTSSITKSYNSSTGVLSAYIRMKSTDTSGVYGMFNGDNTGSVTVYLNPKV